MLPQPAAVSPEEVQSIAAMQDAVLRNLRITECYSRLSAAMRAQVGSGANWCTFATWASRQAGCSIRGEDLGDRLADFAQGSWTLRHPFHSTWRMLLRRGLFNPKTALGRVVHAIHSPFDAFERLSDAVAIGNRKVFEEIGHEFARYLECRDSGEFDRFLNSLKPGPPPEGQDWLRGAFTHYQRQRTEADPSRRAQIMLLANLEIGFHEQTRLQPEIQRAMESAPDTADDLKVRLLRLFSGRWAARMVLAVVMPAVEGYRRFARDLTRQIVSESMMVLRMPPDAVLALGRHLDAVPAAILAAPDDPELMTLMASVDPAGSSCSDCGAEDWGALAQRMHYIFHLFRAFHEKTDLFVAPFTQEQIEEMRSGRIPDGRL